MKKKHFLITLLILSFILFIPSFKASALETEIFYPNGIEDYVDLNNIDLFTVCNEKIFYYKNNDVIYYNKTSKESVILLTNQNVQNLVIAKDYLFVCVTGDQPLTYLLSDLSTTINNSLPSTYNAINFYYTNNNYYVAYIENNTFKVAIYNDIKDTSIKTYSYSQSIDYTFNGAKISFTDDLILLKPLGTNGLGNRLYIFEYPVDTLTPVMNDETPYFIINGLTPNNTINYMISTSKDGLSCVFINNGSTVILEINSEFSIDIPANTTNYDLLVNTNNELFTYSKDNANIYSCDYNPTTNKIQLIDCILAGKGNELGRFKNVTNINLYNDTLLVSDSGNQRIQKISKNSSSEIKTNENTSEVIMDYSNNHGCYYSIFDGLNSKIYKDNNVFVTLENTKVVSIDNNIDGTIFALTNEGKVFKINLDQTYSEIELSQELTNPTKIRINTDLTLKDELGLPKLPISAISAEAKILVSDSNNIFIFKLNGQLLYSTNFESDVLDFKINYYNQILALLNNGNLIKANANNGEIIDSTEGFNDYSCFDIDKITGNMYLYNKNVSAIEVYQNFEINPSVNLSHYYNNLSSKVALSEIWQSCTVKSNASIYDYYYFMGNYKQYSEEFKAIILGGSENNDYYYIGFVKDNIFITGYVKTNDIKNIKIQEITNSYNLRITNKSANLYKYPTDSNYNDNKLTISVLSQGNIVTTVGKFINSIDNKEYYVVKSGTGYGYLSTFDVMLSIATSKNIKTNATVWLFDEIEKTDVLFSGEEDSKIICQIKNGQKINVVDYNKDSTYSHITFVDEDGQEQEGYILTKYVKMNAMSRAVKIAIILVVVDIALIVTLAIFFTHYKKKQKQEENIK